MALAFGSVFSALEVVPLTMLGYSALDDLRRGRMTIWAERYKWPIYYFVAVAFWNMVGAGLFGFMINPPIALYFMQGLNTTPLHGHAALFGVYGMLGIGLMLVCLRAMDQNAEWREGWLRFAFWGMNGGLLMMCVGSLLPVGLAQTWASVDHGYWYARSSEFLHSPGMQTLRWMRVPGDTVFAIGALVLVWFVFAARTGKPHALAARPHPVPVLIDMATATLSQHTAPVSLPREHGATVMLLTPFVCAAILLRQVSWQELVTLLAVFLAFVVKDPLVVIARQRFVWKQERPETRKAHRSAVVQLLLLSGCGLALVMTRDWRWFSLLFLGAGGFTVLAVAVNVRNRQRSVWFQVASAVALTSTSVAACLSVMNGVPGWCWLLWSLSAMQAAAGIFVVHARLDARVAARRADLVATASRTAALLFEWILLVAAAAFIFFGRYWIAAALAIAALGYWLDLRRQKSPAALQMPLTRVGQQALALSILFSIAVIVGLWP